MPLILGTVQVNMYFLPLLRKLHVLTDDEYGERSVSVSLDGDESELIFIDHAAGEMSVRFLKMHYYISCRMNYLNRLRENANNMFAMTAL